jgi:Concanavalin A-like lectin/glucanases superfamily
LLPRPVGYWPLNDATGTTASDIAGGDAANGSNIGWCGGNGNCATFNGSSSQFTTAGPMLNTAAGHGFTVVAAVYMTGTPSGGGSETIVSQDGADDSGFYLQYSAANNRWEFSRVVADTDDDPEGVRAVSTSVPQTWTWTQLVGVFDAADNQLRLYVNGALQGTATDPTPFPTSGDLAIGRAQFDGQATDWFNGAADQVRVFKTALSTAQVDKLKF